MLLKSCTAALLVVLMAPAMGQAQTAKTQVLIVGVSHLVSKRDVHNSVYADSPLSSKRQAQIEEIVQRLARFHPTKVLVEAPYGDRTYPDQYRDYLAGRFTLGPNEIYQYGFKLAARAGNPTIYPVDTWGPTILDDNSPSGKRVDAYLTQHFTSVRDPQADAAIAHDRDLQLHGTYLDELRFLNTDAAIRANASWYSILVGMGRDADNAGATYVSQWYTRNCFIFSNILSTIQPGDRVVVLMGQGHEYLLRDFTRLNPDLVYVDPLSYLQ